MKARKKGTNDEFVPFGVTLNGNWTIYDQSDIEFEQEQEQTLTSNDVHWQNVRERAAIAAMEKTLDMLIIDKDYFTDIITEGFRGDKKTYPNEIADFAVACADALVEQLKKEQK